MLICWKSPSILRTWGLTSVRNWRGLMASTTIGMKEWLAPHLHVLGEEERGCEEELAVWVYHKLIWACCKGDLKAPAAVVEVLKQTELRNLQREA